MAVGEIQWDNLLQLIENHLVVPVVGPELAVVDERLKRTLHDVIADELVGALDWSGEPPPSGSSLETVIRSYLHGQAKRSRRLYLAVFNALTKPRQPWPTPEPLRKLAAITHFDVYVSVTFDSLLEQAINDVRFGGPARTVSRAYSAARPSSDERDLPEEYPPAYSDQSIPTVPAVYHLFGKASLVEHDYTLREEDLLRFYQHLQSPDRRPPHLFDLLAGRDLLLLGTAFPGWLTRLFLATVKHDRLFGGDAAGFLADRPSLHDQDLVMFLERNGTTVYQGDSLSFVDELHRRWTERFADGVTAPDREAVPLPTDPDSGGQLVFISYAREDQRHAESVRDALVERKLHVWFDRRELDPGEDYKREIMSSIEQCSVFVPVISREAIAKAEADESRFLYREWNKARDCAQARKPGTRFIQPVLVGDVRPDEVREFDFHSLQCTRLDDEGALTAFVDGVHGTILRKLRSRANTR